VIGGRAAGITLLAVLVILAVAGFAIYHANHAAAVQRQDQQQQIANCTLTSNLTWAQCVKIYGQP
jgi:hypothetical protein